VEADELVDLAPQGLHRLGRRDRERQHEVVRLATPHRAQRGAHGGARGDAVVHDQRRLAFDGDALAPAEVEAPAPLDLLDLSRGLAFDVVLRQLEARGHVLVHHDLQLFAVYHRGHGQLRLLRRADLAHQHQVQRRPERACDLEADGDAAARQREHEGVAVREAAQLGREQPPGVRAIPEPHGGLPPGRSAR
jgi:hypothetical protein